MSHPYPEASLWPLFAVAASSFWERLDKPGPRSAAAYRRLAARLANPSNCSRARAIFGWLRIAQAPSAETGFKQIAAERGQRVIDPRRNGRERRACDQAVAFETAQRQRQHALRNAADRPPQLVEAQRPAPSRVTTRTDHLSPTRASTSLTARQSAGKCMSLGFIDVPSCAFPSQALI